jgi:hypothetical protein
MAFAFILDPRGFPPAVTLAVVPDPNSIDNHSVYLGLKRHQGELVDHPFAAYCQQHCFWGLTDAA